MPNEISSFPKSKTSSRRAVLSALALAPAAAMPLPCVNAIAGQDPIFDLLEKHKRADAVQKAGAAAEGRIEEQIGFFPGVDITLEQNTRNFRRRRDLEDWINMFRPHDGFIYKDAYEQEASGSLASFDRAWHAFEAKCESSGYNAARRAAGEANGAVSEAENAILRARPQTPSGAVALLLFAAEFAVGPFQLSNEATATVLVNAARTIAGPDVSFNLSEDLEEALTKVSALGIKSPPPHWTAKSGS